MSTVDPTFLEQLLYRGESETLDFKRDQFEFVKAEAEAKSKILKDILSFANSWRQETAYILIGVEEVQGRKGTVVGVTSHLDDAALQQFVNSKTQRPVSFSYQGAVLEGKDVGVIRVPVQERPVYVGRRYGIVEKEAVYLRRGSANAVATPDEVARMGVRFAPVAGQLVVEWADLATGTTKPSPLTVDTALLSPLLPADTFARQREQALAFPSITVGEDPDYSRKLIEFTFWNAALAELGLRIRNGSDVVARRVRLVGSIERADGIVVRRRAPRRKPSRNYWHARHLMEASQSARRDEPDPEVQPFDDRWEVTVEFGDVRPHDEVRTTSSLFLGTKNDQTVVLAGELRGDNLPTPVPCRLEVEFRVKSRRMRRADVREHLEP